MIKFTKYLVAFTLAVAFTLCCGMAVSAESTTLPESEQVSEPADNTETSDIESNIFEDIFASVNEFSPEILSMLTFIGSLLLAFAYKRGLLPTIKNGLGIISGTVGELKASTEGFSKHQEAMISELTERLKQAELSLSEFGKAIDEIVKKAEEDENGALEREHMKALMSAQIDMLYGIFMTSSLPQYQKDAVSEHIHKMKEVSGLVEEGK